MTQQPRYAFGTKVPVTLLCKHPDTEHEMKSVINMEVAGIVRNSNSTDWYYEYYLTDDLPRAYHHGKVRMRTMTEKQIETVLGDKPCK